MKPHMERYGYLDQPGAADAQQPVTEGQQTA
jgi:hypothetical protein